MRNPRYWGARRAYLDRLVVRFRMSSDRPGRLVSERRGRPCPPLRPGLVPAVRREAGVRVVVKPPTAAYEHLTFRLGAGGHPALENKLVRRALAFGIDRTALISDGLFGQTDPSLRPLQSVVFFPQSPHYKANWSIYERNLQRARRLLGEAGCRRGSDGIYVCASERLSLRVVTSAGLPARARLLTLLQAQLRELGVEVLPLYTPGGPLSTPVPERPLRCRSTSRGAAPVRA